MNEFTIEELQWLYVTVEWCCAEFSEPDSTYIIKDKIKSIMDNYCAHENTDDCKSCNSIICEDCNNAIL